MFKFTLIAVFLFITTAVNFVATVISWLRIKTKYGLYFAIGMTAVTFWTLASGLDYAAVPISLKVFFAKWEYLFYHTALVFFLVFILFYAGYDAFLKRKQIQALLWIVPLSNIVLAWTNDWHGWLWRGFTKSVFGDNTVIFEHGPGFFWVAATGYAMITSIILVTWQASRSGSEFSRRQARVLFFASLLPLVGNLFYQFQPHEFDGVDWSSILFSISSLLFLWALYARQLLDLVPIAREKLIESLSDGMIVLDVQGRIVDINQSAARTIEMPHKQLLGRNLYEILPFAKFLSEIPPGQEIRTELGVGNEPKRYFDVLVSPLLENHETILGRLITFHDITSHKSIEVERASIIEELEKRNAESESLRETTVIVTSTLDVSEAVQRILQQIKRVIAYDSASVWLYEGTTTHLVGGDGIPNIPEADKHYQIGENEPDFPLWEENLPYVLLDDVQENYPQFREPPINYIRSWLGVPLKVRGQLIGIISLDSRKVGGFSHIDGQLALTYANQVSIAVENARLFTNLENELEHRQKLIEELDSTNSRLAQEIEERKRIEDELQQLARTDPLTGLFNRRHFFEMAEKEFAKSIRYHRSLSVIIFDIDLFKDINDTYGHLFGDQALVHIGKLLCSSIRYPDIAARYGGEEFIVLLPETNCKDAKIFAERLRAFVESSPLQRGNDMIRLTVSIGVAGKNSNEEVETLDQLISQADQALYTAKKAGRNRVVCHLDSRGA